MSYHVSIGGMEIRGWRVFPKVIWHTYKALGAARRASGCVEASLFRDGRVYFARSVWRTEAAMKAYAHDGVHKALMRHATDWMTRFENVSYASETIPSDTEARAEWQARSGRSG